MCAIALVDQHAVSVRISEACLFILLLRYAQKKVFKDSWCKTALHPTVPLSVSACLQLAGVCKLGWRIADMMHMNHVCLLSTFKPDGNGHCSYSTPAADISMQRQDLTARTWSFDIAWGTYPFWIIQVSKHCVCLATACLAICIDTGVVASQAVLHQTLTHNCSTNTTCERANLLKCRGVPQS